MVDTTIYLPLRVVDPSPQYAIRGGYSTLKPPVISWGSVYDSIRIGDYDNEWMPSIKGYLQDTTWIDTCVNQTWKIQVGLNQFALKDTTYCFRYPIVNGGGVVIHDTIWLTNNVMYQGKQGIQGPTGPQGPQGPQGNPGICPDCPSGGGREGMFEKGWINVEDYGAVAGDGISDVDAFKRAINAAKEKGSYAIWIPLHNSEKTYLIDQAVTFDGNFASWRVYGGGISDNARSTDAATVIDCTNKSGPCFNFVAVRLMELKNIVFQGGNKKAYEFTESSRGTIAAWSPESYVTQGYDMSKFNAQTAVAWDYGQSQAPWSAQCLIENVKVEGFVVGFSISPSAGNYQGDTYTFRKCKGWYNTYFASIGQDQCRAIVFEDCSVNGGYCAYVNNRFGRGNGSAFSIRGGQYTTLFRLLECTNAFRGQMDITGVFGEALGILGSINGMGVNVNAAVFQGCEFGFDDNYYQDGTFGSWLTPFGIFETGSNVVFESCNFHSKKKTVAFGGYYMNFVNSTFTETYPIFPFAQDISISGRALFDNNIRLSDHVSLHPSQKLYVRPTVQTVQTYGNSLRQNFNTKQEVPDYVQIVWQPLPNTSEKQFEWALKPSEAIQYKVGDYLDVTAKNGPDGMGNFGSGMVPGLEVMEVRANSIVLRRVSPEMNVNSDYRSGAVYAGMKAFVSGAPITAKSNGVSVNVANSQFLDVGDFVKSFNNIVRVIAKEGDMVTFSGEVSQGELVNIRF